MTTVSIDHAEIDLQAVKHFAEIRAYMAGQGDPVEAEEVTAFIEACWEEDQILELPRGTSLDAFLKQIRESVST